MMYVYISIIFHVRRTASRQIPFRLNFDTEFSNVAEMRKINDNIMTISDTNIFISTSHTYRVLFVDRFNDNQMTV